MHTSSYSLRTSTWSVYPVRLTWNFHSLFLSPCHFPSSCVRAGVIHLSLPDVACPALGGPQTPLLCLFPVAPFAPRAALPFPAGAAHPWEPQAPSPCQSCPSSSCLEGMNPGGCPVPASLSPLCPQSWCSPWPGCTGGWTQGWGSQIPCSGSSPCPATSAKQRLMLSYFTANLGPALIYFKICYCHFDNFSSLTLCSHLGVTACGRVKYNVCQEKK